MREFGVLMFLGGQWSIYTEMPSNMIMNPHGDSGLGDGKRNDKCDYNRLGV